MLGVQARARTLESQERDCAYTDDKQFSSTLSDWTVDLLRSPEILEHRVSQFPPPP